MKILVLATFIALGFCKNHQRQNVRILDLITKYGYQAESSTVTTEDGYILQLFRLIPGGIQRNEDNNRPAVLLMHGLMSSAEDFVYGGPSQGLAFHLADQGYDVYLGNARGSYYGLEHTTLDPSTDSAFWRFCFHEIGVKDLPAIIDQVRSISQQDKISLVGHMGGATASYVLLSQVPKYNQKIDRVVSLGPIAYLKKSTNLLLESVVDNYKSQSWITKHLGESTFNPSSDFIEEIETRCSNLQLDERFCQNLYFLVNGYNSNKFNQTTIKEVIPRVPSGGTVRHIVHLAQIKDTGSFATFGNQHKEYDLGKISTPVAIFYTPKDLLSHVDDIATLINQLPRVYKKQLQTDYINNLDLIYRNDVAEVNKDIAAALKQKINNVFA